jgi:hypothetical protein
VPGAVAAVLAFLAFAGQTYANCPPNVACDPALVHHSHVLRGLVILGIGAAVVAALVLIARRLEPAIARDASWTAGLRS